MSYPAARFADKLIGFFDNDVSALCLSLRLEELGVNDIQVYDNISSIPGEKVCVIYTDGGRKWIKIRIYVNLSYGPFWNFDLYWYNSGYDSDFHSMYTSFSSPAAVDLLTKLLSTSR